MAAEEKINLLYVITKLELGGAQKHILSLIQGLAQEKFNLFLFTAKEGLLLEQALNITHLKLRRSKFLERQIHPLNDLLALIELYGFIKNKHIKIVHTHSSKAGILGRLAAHLAGVKVVVHTVHGWSFHNNQSGFTYRFYVFLERFCASFSSKLIVVSKIDKDKGLSNSIGGHDKYTLIKYGINHAQYGESNSRDQARKILGLAESELAIGMIACFKPQKAPLDFIKLAQGLTGVLPKAKFILIGDGPLRGKITRLIKRLNIREKFVLTGWRRDIPRILPALDIFVLTSLWEGLPITVLEAMLAGVPVVVTDTGGIGEVISDSINGYLVRPSDTRALHEKVLRLAQDADLRKNFIQRSLGIIGDNVFSLNNMIRNTEELYLGLLRGL